jgi:hypothetical protein
MEKNGIIFIGKLRVFLVLRTIDGGITVKEKCNTNEIIESVEKFLATADELLRNRLVDYDTYCKMTDNKKKFLNKFKEVSDNI